MKNIIIAIVVVILLGVGIYIIKKPSNTTIINPDTTVATSTTMNEEDSTATTTSENEQTQDKTQTIIGQSVKGNDIVAYHFGQGETNILLVGGIHGGYEANTVQLQYQLMDYLKENPQDIPDNINVTVIPTLNPDGLEKVVGTTGRFETSDISTDSKILTDGRFNENNVDLNRNFDCDWQKEGKWQNKTVSGGTEAFSEPESQAFKSYIETSKPSAVVVWYSAAGGVYASNCHNGVLPETQTITDIFAKASGYPAHKEFNFYEITGDAVNWLAKQKIPAISVLLTNHTSTEQDKNIKGLKAILNQYAK